MLAPRSESVPDGGGQSAPWWLRVNWRQLGSTGCGSSTDGRGQESGSRSSCTGGHMSAACDFDEQLYQDAGYSTLIVSRPGYGRTDAAAGPSVPEFAVRLAALCHGLGITRVTAVGISLGARSATTLAALFPSLVEKVILMCPVSFLPWPDRSTRDRARMVFNPVSERLTWAVVRRLLRTNPDRFLPYAVADLSALPGDVVVSLLGSDRKRALKFLSTCRSGRGFMIDLRPPTDIAASVTQPTLILATSNDGSVGMEHPTRLAEVIPNATLVDVRTASHLLWLGAGSERTTQAIQEFLTGEFLNP